MTGTLGVLETFPHVSRPRNRWVRTTIAAMEKRWISTALPDSSAQNPDGSWVALGQVSNVEIDFRPEISGGSGSAPGVPPETLPLSGTHTIQGTMNFMSEPIPPGLEMDLSLMTTPANRSVTVTERRAGGGVSQRRYKRICMALSELFEVLKTGHIATLSSAIPRTATVAHVWFSKESNYFELVIEDDSFELIRDGEKPPLITGPAFGVFEVDWEPLQALLASHDECRELVSSLDPEYATQKQLAAITPRRCRYDAFDERE